MRDVEEHEIVTGNGKDVDALPLLGTFFSPMGEDAHTEGEAEDKSIKLSSPVEFW